MALVQAGRREFRQNPGKRRKTAKEAPEHKQGAQLERIHGYTECGLVDWENRMLVQALEQAGHLPATL